MLEDFLVRSNTRTLLIGCNESEKIYGTTDLDGS